MLAKLWGKAACILGWHEWAYLLDDEDALLAYCLCCDAILEV